MTVKPLYKTAAVIWTESDPSKGEFILMDLPILAEHKYGWCSSMKSVRVADPEKDREWNGTDFLGRVRQRRRVRVPITLSLAKFDSETVLFDGRNGQPVQLIQGKYRLSIPKSA